MPTLSSGTIIVSRQFPWVYSFPPSNLTAQKCCKVELRVCPFPPYAGRRRHGPEACPCPLCTALCKTRPSHRALERYCTSLVRVLGNPEAPGALLLFTPKISFNHWQNMKKTSSTEIHDGVCILWARPQAHFGSSWEHCKCRWQTYPGLTLADPRSGSTFLCHSICGKTISLGSSLRFLKICGGLGATSWASVHSCLSVKGYWTCTESRIWQEYSEAYHSLTTLAQKKWGVILTVIHKVTQKEQSRKALPIKMSPREQLGNISRNNIKSAAGITC